MADRRIGRFRIVAPLGKGGMATVWRAEDEMFGRIVALKLLSDDLASSVAARRRFRHEAEIAMFLDHPAIAPVYAHGEDDGVTWMAMSLIDGQTLAARIARSLVPVDEALRIAGAVGEALGYAHGQDVVHRDVTSNNVMLAKDGRVFVLDFGLARAEGLSHITSTGVTMGTFGYLAPEVLAGQAADARSDLYGLGIMLYEMLTGSTPFAGDRVETIAYRAANEDPEPPSRRRAGLGACVDAFVLKAISRDRAARFRDAAEFAEGLAASFAALGESPPAETRVSSSEVLARALASGGVVYLAVAPIECAGQALAPLGVTLADAFRARLSGSSRVRLVGAHPPADPADWREFARAAGASAILAGRLRESGARVRLELWLTDPEDGMRLAGRHADGLSFEPFALEDAALDQARAMLGLAGDSSTAVTHAVRRDPAAEEHYAQALRYLERHDHEPSVDGALNLLERLAVAELPKPEWLAALTRGCLMKYALTRQRAWEGRAAEACAKARRMAPDLPDVLLAWSDIMRVAGRDAEAIEGYERVLATKRWLVEAWTGLADVHRRKGKPGPAEDAARHAIEAAPHDWRGHNALGFGQLQFGAIEESLESFRRAVALSPDNVHARRNMAIALAQSDRLGEAADVLRELVALEPSDAAFANLGAALFALGDRAGALDALARATRLAPADPRRWGNLASALRFEPGREREAAEAFDRAIGLMQDQLARDADEPEAWSRLADWLQARGREVEADAAIARALAIAPGNVHCMVHAAFVRHQRGDREGTLDWLRKALARGYSTEVLRRSQEFHDLHEDSEFASMLEGAARSRRTGSTAPGRAQREEPE
jgi:tetratricopeptide (TPR) repeat protein